MVQQQGDIWEGAPLEAINFPVALFGDAPGIWRGERWCAAAGFRAQVCGWNVDKQPRDAAVRLIVLDSELSDQAARVVQMLDEQHGTDDVPLVIASPIEAIDLCAASAPAAYLLVDPPVAEVVGTMMLAAKRATAIVNELRPERDAAQLRKLTEDVERIARVLASLASDDDTGGLAPGVLPDEDDAPAIEPAQATSLIRRFLRARRLRDRYFSSELFSDPAWDMLLDLAAARIERKRVAVSSLCIAAAVPPTTALRHIRSLTDAGIFVRRPDLLDGRRVFIELSDRAAAAMMNYLGRVAGDFVAGTA